MRTKAAVSIAVGLAACHYSATPNAQPASVVGASLPPSRADVERPCRALCALSPSYAGATRPAPAFSLRNEAGDDVSYESLRGKVVVLNLWMGIAATAVTPEMPALAKLAKALRGRTDAVLVSIAGDAYPERAKRLLEATLPAEDRYPVLYDPEAKVATLYGTEQFPETFILDRGGVIRARFDGPRKWDDAKVIAFIDALSEGKFCPAEIEEGEVRGVGAEFCGGM